jgi:hypothetical protein
MLRGLRLSKSTRGYCHGTSVCSSALFTAGRYDELSELVQGDVLWCYKRWAVKALASTILQLATATNVATNNGPEILVFRPVL